MKLLPEVGRRSRNNWLDFGGDSEQDPDLIRIALICMKLLPEVCLRPRTHPFNFGDDPDYKPDPDREKFCQFANQICNWLTV